MPASIIPIAARRRGVYVLLDAVLPQRSPQTIGALLLDPESDRLWIRLRQSYDELADPEDAEVLEALEGEIRARAAELGAEAYVASLEDSLSNALRVSERHAVPVDSFTRVLDRIYREHVQPLAV